MRLSEFYELPHAYLPAEVAVPRRDFDTEQTLFGPLLVESDGDRSALLAYEYGSRVPDA